MVFLDYHCHIERSVAGSDRRRGSRDFQNETVRSSRSNECTMLEDTDMTLKPGVKETVTLPQTRGILMYMVLSSKPLSFEERERTPQVERSGTIEATQACKFCPETICFPPQMM